MTPNTDPQGVEGAAHRITRFLAEWPARQRDPEEIYGLHTGHEREANLTVSDLRTILASHESLRAELERVREAGQAVVDRWDSPLWKEAEPTAHVVNRLRTALNREG